MDKVNPIEYKELFEQLLGGTPMLEEKLIVEIEGGDEIDTVNLEKSRQLELRLLSRNHVFLKKVRHALARINAGTFGECEECGGDIGSARLAARPTATLCIQCKEEEERGEQGLIHKNRHSVKWNTNVLPIDAKKRWGTQEDKTHRLSVSMGDHGLDSTAS